MPRIGLVILSLFLVGCATSGDGPSVRSPQEPTDPQVAEAVKDNQTVADAKDKVICTRETAVGTHFSRRVCRTVRKIEEDREAARRSLEDQIDGVGGGGPG